MNKQAPELDESNAQYYRANPDFSKHAVLNWMPSGYHLGWGVQTFDGPHMVIGDLLEGDELYGCALEEFFTTHSPLPSKENLWFKRVRVLALRVKEATDIVTIVDGREESRSTIPSGHWIIRNPKGEQYYNDPITFSQRYILDARDEKDDAQ